MNTIKKTMTTAILLTVALGVTAPAFAERQLRARRLQKVGLRQLSQRSCSRQLLCSRCQKGCAKGWSNPQGCHHPSPGQPIPLPVGRHFSQRSGQYCHAKPIEQSAIDQKPRLTSGQAGLCTIGQSSCFTWFDESAITPPSAMRNEMPDRTVRVWFQNCHLGE